MQKATIIRWILLLTIIVSAVSLLNGCGASSRRTNTSFEPMSENQPFSRHDVVFKKFKRKPVVTWRFEGKDIEHPIGAVGFHIYAGHNRERLVENFDQTVWSNLNFYDKEGDQIASIWTPEGNVNILHGIYTHILELLQTETFFEMHLHSSTGVYVSNGPDSFNTDLSDWGNGTLLIVPVK